MFRRLFRALTNRWFITALGLLAVAALIWFVGPLIGIADMRPLETPVARLSAIAIVIVLWGLNRLRKFLMARRTNEEILEGIAEPEPDTAAVESAEEVALLQSRFKEAMAVLKTARFDDAKGRDRRHLFQLPWYVIIGPPGCGKTTILKHSGLQFPLSDRFGTEAIHGVGGTRNCDWWFTDQAVLLDTAGRYTTQDSHQEVDSAAWTGFLRLLKKHRRRRPINGALVAISLSDLVQQSEMEREAHARAIHQRIRELHENLNIRFPVYVLLTKCDLVAGFTEFFDDMGRAERAQVWGATFPAETIGAPAGLVDRFRAEFAALRVRLVERLSERLQQERDPARRAELYLFPQQFAALEPVVDLFLKQVFQASQYEHTPLLRGVYFTSGTQEGNPIDRLMDAMAGHFGLERAAVRAADPIGRSYFVLSLLKDVVFNESGLAGTNLKLERFRQWLQIGAYAATIGAIALAAGGWFTSYRLNQTYVDQVQAQAEAARGHIEELNPLVIEPSSTLDMLNILRNIPAGYAEREASVPWSMGLGLYQGDKLGREARHAYGQALVNQFLPRVLLELEQQLKEELSSPRVNFDRLYENLKVYLMLEDREHFEVETIFTWMAFAWSQRLGHQVTAEDRRELETHLDALLGIWPDPIPVRLDADLISRARAKLREVSAARRVYGRLRRDREVLRAAPAVVLTDQVRSLTLAFKRTSERPLNEPVPGLFTYKGYHEAFKSAAKRIGESLAAETWVLGEEAASLPEFADQSFVLERVTEFYMEDYIRIWKDLLDDLEIVPFANFDQAVDVLGEMSGRSSPLVSLLQIVAQETTLTRTVEVPDGVVEAVERRLRNTRVLRDVIGSDSADAGATAEAAGASALSRFRTKVDEEFERLNELSASEAGQAAAIQEIVGQLAELYRYVHGVSLQPDRGLLITSGQANGDARILTDVKRMARDKEQPVRRWVEALVANVNGLATVDARQALNDAWRREGRRFCADAIAGRYPFNRSTEREVRLDDFTGFFGPGGIMETFFNQYLRSHVDTSRRPWQMRSRGAQPLRIAGATLEQFERAHVI
ncbi:MAG: type VI secretion system membrane subunit TssM, partial [Gammaproteobacteria bacterium]